jgi:hypothetical protein
MLADCSLHILGGAVDHEERSGGAHRVDALAARNADDHRPTIGQKRDEHSTDSARSAPHHGRFSLDRPNASKTSGGEPSHRQACAILKAE